MSLNKRAAIITVDSLRVECGLTTNLDCSFHVKKTRVPSPNTAHIEVTNLSRTHLGQLVAKAATALGGNNKGVRVRLEAGYVGQTFMIYEGDIKHIYPQRTGADLVLIIETGDGEKAWKQNRINKSYAPGTSIETVLNEVALALGASGIGKGNLLSKIKGVTMKGWGSVFTGGTVVSGRTVDQLTRLTRSVGLEWSIQDGQLQLLESNGFLSGTAFVLNSETGLVDSPALDHKGLLTAKTLMIPNLVPGRNVKLEAQYIKGLYTVQHAKYIGDTAGQDWYIEIEAKRI